MVCVPCFIIPVLLYVWHRFVQPIMLRYWNPWAVKDADGNVVENTAPEFPFQCAGGVCPFPGAKKTAAAAAAPGGDTSCVAAASDGRGASTAAAPSEETKKSA